MAVSFNATTTEVNSAFASHATQRTYSIWTYRVGNGESGLGRLLLKLNSYFMVGVLVLSMFMKEILAEIMVVGFLPNHLLILGFMF